MGHYQIGPHHINLQTLEQVLGDGCTLSLSDGALGRIRHCREYLDQKIQSQSGPIYGVTTGFGSLCDTSISHDDLGRLQQNLVMSHACGTGDPLPDRVVRLMLFLKIQSLSYGHSGIRQETVERLIAFFNEGIYPVVFSQGSLGASGDLAPLAHLSLPLLGLGEVVHKGRRRKSSDVLAGFGWPPLALESKEGLALLNGTQFMGAIGSYCLLRAKELSRWADLCGALSLEAFNGRIEPFLEPVHRVRPHPGQMETASVIRRILEGSRLMELPGKHVQDPYSFRCMPQVHGASKDAIAYVESVFETEMNAVTDNPTLFPDQDLIISAGNFHGQPLALSLDFLGMALAELGNISERRVYRLISGARGLPSFLVANPGLNSGFMIPQYAAASIVSQNKQLCTPASVDSIESSQGQEDHVSMGANAATKTLQIVANLERLLAIELMNACQAMGFREAGSTSPVLRQLMQDFVATVPFIENDKVMHDEMEKALDFIRSRRPGNFL